MARRELVLVLFLWVALAVNETSTEPLSLRLVGGDGRCRGQLEVQRSGQNWTGVEPHDVPLSFGDRVCPELDCGPALSVVAKRNVSEREAMDLFPDRCDDTSLIDCFTPDTHGSNRSLEVNCLDSVRLVSGQSLCSGSLQIWDQSLNDSWTWVCEGALDHRGAEVLCRELSCGAPLHQGKLSPLGQRFHCEGHESALKDCPQTHPGTCSGPTLNLTCAEPFRLVGGASRCEGIVETNIRAKWLQMEHSTTWDLEAADVVCRGLGCGSVVTTEQGEGFSDANRWKVNPDCVKNNAAVKHCVSNGFSGSIVVVVCSDLLNIPEVSISEGVWEPRAQESVQGLQAQGGVQAAQAQGGVWVLMGADFQVKCSVEPQYPGGSFRLLSPSLNLTQPAVNHSAHFLFTDAGHAHRGSYTCVYLLQKFNHNFSSNSSLHIYPGESDSQLLLRALILFLLQLLNFIPYIYYRLATRGCQRTQRARGHRAFP